MTVTAMQTQKILSGNQKFSQLGLSMMITRLKSIYAKDSSQAVLLSCTDEINLFLQKYGAILAEDYSVISKL